MNNNLCSRCQNNTEEGLCLKGQSQFMANTEGRCSIFIETASIQPLGSQHSLSLAEVIELIHTIQTYPQDTIVIRKDTAETLAAAYNPNRAQLLVFLEDIFTQDIFDCSTSDFFYNYLRTLQPFMYIKSVLSEDSESSLGIYHKVMHVFEYPCGTQSIQIKVCLKDDNIVLISFHKGASGLESLANRYRKTIELFEGTENCLLFLSRSIRIWIDHIYMDILADEYDKHSMHYFSNLDSFFSSYRAAFASILNSSLEGYASRLVLGLKSKVSVYSAISMAELSYNRDLLTDKGRVHALASLRALLGYGDTEKLDTELQRILTTAQDTDDVIDWLTQHELPGGIPELLSLTTRGDSDSNE